MRGDQARGLLYLLPVSVVRGNWGSMQALCLSRSGLFTLPRPEEDLCAGAVLYVLSACKGGGED